MSKINFNASGEQMTNEVHSNVGANEFSLDHSVFLQSGFLCSRLSGGTQPLTYGVDYILTSINERLRTEAGIVTYQKVKILNAAYQTGALYFTYKAVADFLDAEDWDAGTVDSLHANDNAITDNDTTLSTKNKVKTYADTKIAKTTNVTAIDDTGIANGEIAVFNLTAKTIKTSDKVFSTDGTLADNSDSKIPTEKAVKTYANGTTGTGYTKLPGGITFQWGRILLPAGASGGSVTFPISFTVNKSMSVIIQEQGVNLSEKVGITSVPSLTGFNYNYNMSDETYVFWIAIGY